MKRAGSILSLSAIFLSSCLLEAATLKDVRLLKSEAPSCAVAFNSPPAGVSGFLTTDVTGFIWFTVSDVAANAEVIVEIIRPDGRTYGDVRFDNLVAGNHCFTVRFDIAGKTPGNTPGTWRVSAVHNAQPLFNITFEISTPGSGGGSSGGGSSGGGTSGNTVTVDAKANIFSAGRSASFGGGILPPVIRFAAGPNQAIRFPSVTGTATCTGGGPPNGPDGGTCVSNSTDVGSYQGIAGITHPRKTMFLVGVFLDDNEPRDPAPPRLDFSDDNFTVLSPLIGQVFFIGDGMSNTGFGGTGQRQLFNIPPTATRLFLGIADAGGFHGSPGFYDDNSGSFVATWELTTGTGGAGAGGGTGGGAVSGNLNVNINQVIDTACPANKLIVSVTDSQGNPVAGLTASNFTVKENGAVRNITVTPVGSSSSGLASVAIVIDLSSSLSESDLANEKTAAKQLVAQLGPSDEAAVYGFASSVNLQQSFTNNKNLLNTAIDRLQRGGSTALYAAIQRAAQDLTSRGGRKAIVVMTDGRNNIDPDTPDSPIAAARAAGAPVFTVGFGSSIDTAALTRIATETGGFYSAGATSVELERILRSIGQVITSQYEISYTSGSPTTDNLIEVTVTAGSAFGTVTRTVNRCSSSGGGTGGGGTGGGTGGGGTGGGVIVTPGCNYFVNPLANRVPGGGATGALVLVNTNTNCQWGVRANDAWITIKAPSGGQSTGSGAVSYDVAPNPNPSSRTGTITIANQTHTVTQDAGGATAGCTYTLTPTSANVSGAGGIGGVLVTASGATCQWTAQSTVSWITITSATSGTGTGRVSYNVAANSSTAPRSGTLTIAGLTFTVVQAAGGSGGGPMVTGVTNAASNVSADFPDAGIAQGAFFSLYGTGLGPAQFIVRTEFPLLTRMGGVRVLVRQGSNVMEAVLYFVSATQINGIMPSNAPLGDVEMIVEYNGVASPPIRTRVVRHYFGIFTTAGGRGPGIIQNYVSPTALPLNTPQAPALPGQVEILLGTGLGAINAPDNIAPPVADLPVSVEVFVGGKLARRLYSGRMPGVAGVDQINYEVPIDAPRGCYVPVQIKVGNTYSNVATMAIAPDAGSSCAVPGSPVEAVAQGGKMGVLALVRANLFAALQQGQPPIDSTIDIALGYFAEMKSTGPLSYNPLVSIPPLGTCTVLTGALNLNSLLGTSSSSLQGISFLGKELDAGTELTVNGPGGSRPLPHSDAQAGTGPYVALLGGNLPVQGSSSLPLYLNPGAYTFTGPGGKDIGAFSASVNLPAPITWTNRDQINTIVRNSGLTLTWSGGDPNAQTVLIAGGSSNQQTNASGAFVCLAPVSNGSFQVPANVLASVPPSASTNIQESLAGLIFGTLPTADIPKFTAPGLDLGLILYGNLQVKTVTFQ